MDHVARASKLLRDTEASLRGLLSEAATSGDYASVVQIASWARTVHELIKATPSDQKNATQDSPGVSEKLAKTTRGARTSQPPKRNMRDEYPQFFRNGDQLIRVSWSRREKKEYQHKTSCAVVNALAAAMANKGREGRVFSTDELLPIQDPSDASDVPSYQAYVGISLMKQTGLIDQHGRQGYSIPRIAEFKDNVGTVLKKLPVR